ncbi:MAG: hypothetical protein ACP6IY_15800 [Promethearchaeia archaeon]
MKCFVCKKDFSDKPDRLYYCFCDTTVCTNCINSVKKNDKVWICPNCKAENDLDSTLLIRGS